MKLRQIESKAGSLDARITYAQQDELGRFLGRDHIQGVLESASVDTIEDEYARGVVASMRIGSLRDAAIKVYDGTGNIKLKNIKYDTDYDVDGDEKLTKAEKDLIKAARKLDHVVVELEVKN